MFNVFFDMYYINLSYICSYIIYLFLNNLKRLNVYISVKTNIMFSTLNMCHLQQNHIFFNHLILLGV